MPGKRGGNVELRITMAECDMRSKALALDGPPRDYAVEPVTAAELHVLEAAWNLAKLLRERDAQRRAAERKVDRGPL